ncbi:MAG: transglycosylase domain-containing protein [Rudaea sp.]
MRWRRLLAGTVVVGVLAAAGLAVATWQALMPLPAALSPAHPIIAQQVLAVDGTPLNLSFSGQLNATATLPMSQMPQLIRAAFTVSEDRHYWQHGGADWTARLAALWSNFRAGQVERGASTIGEQAARILDPRPRTYWSHWMAGFDAARLLHRFGHAAVFEFYLNQVPYGAQRRGIVAAAHYYFGREPAALDPAEQVALAVLVRSPSRYDPRAHPHALRGAIDQLAGRMRAQAAISNADAQAIQRAPITLGHMPLSVEAGAFVVYARQHARSLGLDAPVVRSTLDPGLQTFVQQVLRRHLTVLSDRDARNAAALVVDNDTGAVLAWAVAPSDNGLGFDPVIVPRQPGSTLKPFVYGLAMQRLDWQPDHLIEDTPLAESVDEGVHRYRNYSGRHYGHVSLRYALANSLNIPAVRTAQAVGVPPIVDLLQRLGFTGLDKSADHYGPAIVLGDGAVPLFDLVQGYASLARHGQFLPLRVLDDAPPAKPIPVLSPEVTSILASILSDPNARSAEFGANSILDLPYPTAVKTGTSSDYRDTWAVGFDNRYTVGVWVGRLEGGSTDRLTGSSGSAPALRQIFDHLRSTAPYAGLWQSPQLHEVSACEWIGPPACVQRMEWQLPGPAAAPTLRQRIAIAEPVTGEILAINPRVARARQRLLLRLDVGDAAIHKVQWRVDGQTIASSETNTAEWTLTPGRHRLDASVWLQGELQPRSVSAVDFEVLGGDNRDDADDGPSPPDVAATL